MHYDPVAGPVNLVFFLVGLVLCAWIALDTRRSLQLITRHPGPLSEKTVASYRRLAAFMSIMLLLLTLRHLFFTVR